MSCSELYSFITEYKSKSFMTSLRDDCINMLAQFCVQVKAYWVWVLKNITSPALIHRVVTTGVYKICKCTNGHMVYYTTCTGGTAYTRTKHTCTRVNIEQICITNQCIGL